MAADPDATPDRPATGAAGGGEIHPTSEAQASSELGAPPQDLPLQDSSGSGRRRMSQDAAVTAADNDVFWRKSFHEREYTDASRGYDHYRPAYRYGWEASTRHGGTAFSEVEGELRSGWDADTTRMSWDEARPAVRDAYERQDDTDNTDTATPGNPLA